MKTKMLFRATLLGVVTILLATSYAQARDAAPGYVQDRWGNIVTGGFGDCARSDYWESEMATIVGCDGVTVDAKVETIKGKPSGILTEIVMPSTAMFAFDSAELTEEGKK